MALRLSNGQKLHSPEGLEARPTTSLVRQAVMNILAADLAQSRWLDLCSGSGAMACDCLLYTSPSPRDRTRSRMPSSA